MLKLCRNAFATLRVFHSDDGRIDYQFIKDLVRVQEDLGLKLGTKV